MATGISRAQTVKTISVSNEESYTDHISLAEDARDMDVMVKFIFDEAKNTLRVSVLSYRGLFVFREPARYSSVIRCSHLHPDLLPYVAECDPKTTFKLSKQLRKSIPCPKGKYIFKRWIEYEGLQPLPSDYKMVNDYIEQDFDIQHKLDKVTVTLKDLFLLERSGKRASEYLLMRGRDLNVKYRIEIQRNPCLGMEDEIASAGKLCSDAAAAWLTFRRTYDGGNVSSAEALKTCEETRTLLLTQFPARQNQSSCPQIRSLMHEYNSSVDSIATFTCKLREEEPVWDTGKGLDVKMIYSQARQLDKAVARWLVSKDELERQDLVSQCRDIVEDVSGLIKRHKPVTAEEMKAVKVYKQAEQYFKRTCKQ